MNTKESIYQIVSNAIKEAKNEGIFPDDIEYPNSKIEYPKEQKFGDYSTPFALESAKILRKSPMEIGENLKPFLERSDIIDKVEVVRPGFINIFLSHEYLCNNLSNILNLEKEYGKRVKEKPEKINIEFVSANPTGPLNIVSARAAAIGDTIANLLEMNGDIVDREFYVNDYGNQVYLLGKSVLSRIKEIRNEDTVFPEDGYQGEYVKNIAEKINDEFKDEIDNKKNEEDLINFLAEKSIEYNVATQKHDLEKFNVNYKFWFHERTLHEKGEVDKTLEYLESLNTIYIEDGKKVFKSTDHTDDKDRVVVRDDGRPTYLLADIAYHKDKINRNYDHIIDIWGPDHHGYIARLSGAMKAMGYDENKFRVLIAQQVNLLVEGETVKMSKRLGKFSTMSELIEEIGVDVARYFFIMRSLDSHLDFDLALAKKESSENPVFYLQYAHARICSIFREAANRDILYDKQKPLSKILDNPEAIILMKLMLKFPEEISDAAENYEPHRISNFLLRLAQAFHKFYAEHRILSDNLEKTISYLYLSNAIKIVMKNGLKLLGVDAPEKM